jgi:hypothetical protein
MEPDEWRHGMLKWIGDISLRDIRKRPCRCGITCCQAVGQEYSDGGSVSMNEKMARFAKELAVAIAVALAVVVVVLFAGQANSQFIYGGF